MRNYNSLKLNLLKSSVFALISILAIACSKDDIKEETITTTQTTITTTNAGKVNVTAVGINRIGKPNSIVAIFDELLSITGTLPRILTEKTTNANGLAAFDFNSVQQIQSKSLII